MLYRVYVWTLWGVAKMCGVLYNMSGVFWVIIVLEVVITLKLQFDCTRCQMIS